MVGYLKSTALLWFRNGVDNPQPDSTEMKMYDLEKSRGGQSIT